MKDKRIVHRRVKEFNSSENNLEGLNSYEVSMLFLTNPYIFPRRMRYSRADLFDLFFWNEPYFPFYEESPYAFNITTKEAYIWGSVLTTLYSRYEITTEDIHLASQRAAEGFVARFVDPQNQNDLFDPYSKLVIEANSSLITNFVNYFEPNNPQLLQSSISSTTKAYRSLLKQGLIEDPFEVTLAAITFGVLGFIPYSFTNKTSKGKRKERQIKALFWEYLRTGDKTDETVEFNFRLLKLIQSTILQNLKNITKQLDK